MVEAGFTPRAYALAIAVCLIMSLSSPGGPRPFPAQTLLALVPGKGSPFASHLLHCTALGSQSLSSAAARSPGLGSLPGQPSPTHPGLYPWKSPVGKSWTWARWLMTATDESQHSLKTKRKKNWPSHVQMLCCTSCVSFGDSVFPPLKWESC